MTAFTYNTGVPAAANNPSNDQPIMLINCQSIDSIIGVDHITFNSSGTGGAGASGGQHLQVTFNGKNVPSGLPVDPISIEYTNSGTASTVSQLFYANQNGTFHLSPIKAWGLISAAGGTILASQAVNVSTVTRVSSGVYNIVLTVNAVNSVNFAIIATASDNTAAPTIIFYTITGIGQFTIFTTSTGGAPRDPTTFSFTVIQI